MDADQLRQQSSIKRALVCLLGAAFQTPRISKCREQLEEADQEIAALDSAQSIEGNRGDGPINRRLRTDLRKHHLNPLGRHGAFILKGVPGIKDMLRVPHLRTSDKKLVEAARRIINNVREYEDTLIESGYRADFIERAERAIDALEAKAADPNTRVNRRSRATASLPEALAHGREIMEAVDRLVEDDLVDNRSAREMWKNVKHLPGRIGRPKNRRRPPEPLP